MSRMKSVLVVAGHSDDADYACGGTLVKFAREGTNIVLVVVTRGEKGTLDPHIDMDAFGKIRREEQDNSAKILGINRVVYLDYSDHDVLPTHEFRAKLIKEICRYKPDIVMTHDPWKRYECHPDHRHTGMMAIEAASFSLYSTEIKPADPLLEPHLVSEIWLFNTDNPNYWVDITDTIDKKLDALIQHKSQLGEEMAKFAQRANAKTGAAYGVKFAEEFRILRRGFPYLYE
ncbi:MAG: PIG-L family deacetylase [Candidatus Freyarchaeota archaeon]|nr:PIG-L family deacetylase [Candidatus Jordarchaeia archaeon]MBS7267297.1 PIG-L family deacetylase [Candidatus Jordarchaeia archaeon]MBS7278271.1 PIG-L family deacetylase [Candidatus Jordarchaeia archaeon]